LSTASAPLVDGSYKLTIKGADPVNSIEDLAGNKLGGGVDSVSTFTIDRTPPNLTVALTPNVLWQANGQMVNIQTNITASDALDPNPKVTLLSITSSDPNTNNDIQNTVYGTDDRTFSLRGANSGSTSRTYTVTYLAQDAAGNGRIVSADVLVPVGT